MLEDRHVRLGRLRWQCRRALLELDLLFERFWQRYGDTVDLQDEAVLGQLLALDDYDLWALVSGTQKIDDPQLIQMIERIRNEFVPLDHDRISDNFYFNATT
ncbi:MAG: succinate dehydrogenase assembly factor 2 [Rugosibacter sp.]|jgi:antitoxin CptB|nr:succinate dehydrogenase assembly factor 2 [Rugosibacter sp.]MDO9273324.1 succinate dehydrogenase assembly factor 2 [Rugosibacter sp.]